MALPEQNILVCHGDDEIAISKYIHSLESELNGDSMGEMNISRLDGKICSEADLSNIVNSIPFFTERRLVILTNPFAKLGRGKKIDEDEIEDEKSSSGDVKKKFISFLDGVPESTLLALIVDDSGKLDYRTGEYKWDVLKPSNFLVKWLKQNNQKVLLVPFPLPSENDMPGWIQKEAVSKKCKFSPAAATELAQYVGNDTRLAAMEIEKLALFVGGERSVEAQDVMNLSTSTASGTIWNLVDAIGTKNTGHAMTLYHQLLESREAQYEIFPMIIRQFRLLLMAREVLDERGNKQMIMSDLGVAPFVAEKLIGQASKFTMNGLKKIYLQLMKIEEESKTSGGDLETAIDVLILSVAGD